MPAKNSGIERENKIIPLCDGIKTSKEIADILGESAKYVQRIMLKHNLPRLPQAPRCGKHNPAFVCGKRIDRDGYVLVSAPLNHPYARKRKDRAYGIIYEHRLILENKIGRVLLPSEVVDHIDGLRLHNSPSNLRLFAENSEHLKKTISGKVPNWSEDGLVSLDCARKGLYHPPVNNYDKMKKSGDARLRQILLAALSLGIDSPFLSETPRLLKKAGISDFSHSNLEHELEKLYRKYA